ncbi:MAG: hypothetical protein GY769_22415 [bacterium]|nr:hypothetical protein [bacterium]
MSFDTELKLAIYRHVAETTTAPTVEDMVRVTGRADTDIREGYRRLNASRVLVLEDDGVSIRMAPPFSGVETQHKVTVAGQAGEAGKNYYANCAWDSLGVVAALSTDGEVESQCGQSLEPIRLRVRDGELSGDSCVAHYAVPAAHWWDDIVYT